MRSTGRLSLEAQGLINQGKCRDNVRVAREKDEARWNAVRAPPGPPPSSLPPMPVAFPFGGFSLNPN